VGSSYYTASNGGSIKDQLTDKDRVQSGQDTIPTFEWNDWEKPQLTSIRTVGVTADIRTVRLLNKNQKAQLICVCWILNTKLLICWVRCWKLRAGIGYYEMGAQTGRQCLVTSRKKLVTKLFIVPSGVINVLASNNICTDEIGKTKLRGQSSRANHTDRAAAAGRRS
jgi:hypothetical protein